MLVLWYHICPKVFLSEIPEKASESFLSEVVLPKLFRPKVFDFNVQENQLSDRQNIKKLQFWEKYTGCPRKKVTDLITTSANNLARISRK